MLRIPRALVLGLPLLELALLIGLVVVAGFGVALIEIIATGVVGSVMLRSARQGMGGPDAQGAMPMAAMVSGGPRMISGALLMLPGLLSDTAGLLLLIPPVRKWVLGRAQKSVAKRMAQMMNDPSAFMGGMPSWGPPGAGGMGGAGGWPAGAPGAPPQANPSVQQAEVLEVTPIEPPRLDDATSQGGTTSDGLTSDGVTSDGEGTT